MGKAHDPDVVPGSSLQHKVILMLFYDYPTVPEGIFDDFLAIPYLEKDVKTRTFTDLIAPTPTTSNLTTDMRR